MNQTASFAIAPFTNPSGEIVFRVTGWLDGKRVRKNFPTRAEADAERQVLEVQRAQGQTRLNARSRFSGGTLRMRCSTFFPSISFRISSSLPRPLCESPLPSTRRPWRYFVTTRRITTFTRKSGGACGVTLIFQPRFLPRPLRHPRSPPRHHVLPSPSSRHSLAPSCFLVPDATDETFPSRLPALLPGLRWLAPLSPFWQLQIAGWTLLAVATFPLKVAAFDSLAAALFVAFYREPLGLLLSSGLRVLYRRLDLAPARPVRLVACVLVASIFSGLIDTACGALIHRALGHEETPTFLLGVFSFRGALFIVWSFLYFWIKALLVARAHELGLVRARTAAREAELQLLRAQVDPHFLFNALNSLLALVPGNQRADDAIRALSSYLRYSLAHRADELVPLAAEFEATAAYLAVEQARFRDDLVLDLRLADGARDLLVPGVLLQPLVENAVKHGRETAGPPHHVRLHVVPGSPGPLRIEVSNTGSWCEPSSAPGPHGNGLANLRRRLALLYPGRHRIDIASAGGWVNVVVTLDDPARP